MQTKLHRYTFNTRNADEAKAYSELAARLRAEIAAGTRGREMHCIVTDHKRKSKPGGIEAVELETGHLFGNQWNTTNERVFDWFECYQHDRSLEHIKWGHWLEMTPEMLAIRRDTLKCGYTGQQFPASAGFKFNETAQGLGSEYLKESELSMLRLRPVDKEDEDRAPLTPEELAYLLPKYRAMQKEGAETRAGKAKAAARAQVAADYIEATTISEKELRVAAKKRDAFVWLLDRGFSLENVIYYSHTDKFCFGWRNALTAEQKSALLDVLSEFPFDYEFHKNS